MKFDYVVLGGGTNGICTGLALAKRKLNVAVIEQFSRDHQRGSSHGQGRIIRYLYPTNEYAQLMPASFKHWKTIEEKSGKKLFTPAGIMNISSSEDKSMSTISNILSNMNVDHELFNAEESRKKFPMNFENDDGVVLEKEAGILNASLCVRTVGDLFLEYGGKLIENTKIVDIKVNADETIKLIPNQGSEITCKQLVLCCGAWAGGILKNLNLELPLHPIRVDVPYWKIRDDYKGKYHYSVFPAGIYDKGPPQRTMKEDDGSVPYHIYWTPELEYPGLMKIAFHGSIGGEINPDQRDKNQAGPSERLLKRLAAFLEEKFPGINFEDGPAILESCIYTTTPDDDFILDKHPAYDNITIAAGFSGHGFKMSPETGEILADLATGQKPKYDLTPFSLNRFKK